MRAHGLNTFSRLIINYACFRKSADLSAVVLLTTVFKFETPQPGCAWVIGPEA